MIDELREQYPGINWTVKQSPTCVWGVLGNPSAFPHFGIKVTHNKATDFTRAALLQVNDVRDKRDGPQDLEVSLLLEFSIFSEAGAHPAAAVQHLLQRQKLIAGIPSEV